MEEKSGVMILGLGSNAGRVLSSLSASALPEYVTTLQADTDAAALKQVAADRKLQLGEEWTDGLGCGGDVKQGERAGKSSVRALGEELNGARLVVVVASLGGGTGSGAIHAVAQVVREQKLPAVFLCVLPTSLDGNRPVQVALRAVQKLRAAQIALIALPGNSILSNVGRNEDFSLAYARLNSYIAASVRGVVLALNEQAVKPIDYAVLRNHLLERKAECGIGLATIQDEASLRRLVDAALQSPLLGGPEKATKADVLVASLVGDFTLGGAESVVDTIHRRFPSSVKTEVGVQFDRSVPQRAGLTLLAIRYEADTKPKKQIKRAQPMFDPTATRQMRLAIGVEGVGIFSKVQATIHREQNLDVPTFQRQGIELEVR